MNVNKFELEEEEKLAAPPPDDLAAMLAKYEAAREQGDKDVAKAQSSTDTSNLILSLGSGVANIFGGQAEAHSGGRMRSSGSGALDNMIAANNEKMGVVRAASKAKLDNVQKQDELARSFVERGQKDKEFALKDAANDPASNKSVASRPFFAKKLGVDPKTLTTASYADMEKLSKESGEMSKFQLGKLELDNRREKRVGEQFSATQVRMFQGRAAKATQSMRQTDSWKSSEVALGEESGLRAILHDAKTNGGQSISVLGVKMAKALGEVGALSESDVTRYVKDPSIAGQIRDTMARLKSGKISGESAENLERVLDAMSASATRKRDFAIHREATIFSRVNNIPLDEARFFLDEAFEMPESATVPPGPSALPKQVAPASNTAPTGTAPPKEIKRKTADGRTAIFNESKEFLRYED